MGFELERVVERLKKQLVVIWVFDFEVQKVSLGQASVESWAALREAYSGLLGLQAECLPPAAVLIL